MPSLIFLLTNSLQAKLHNALVACFLHGLPIYQVALHLPSRQAKLYNAFAAQQQSAAGVSGEINREALQLGSP